METEINHISYIREWYRQRDISKLSENSKMETFHDAKIVSALSVTLEHQRSKVHQWVILKGNHHTSWQNVQYSLLFMQGKSVFPFFNNLKQIGSDELNKKVLTSG